MCDDDPGHHDGHGLGFWIALVVGWTVIAGAVAGLVVDAADTHPANFLVYFAGAAVLHDLVVAPVVVSFGWLVVRRLPAEARSVVAGALIVIGTASLYAFPFVRGYGRDPANPSLLPNDYGTGLAVLVAVVVAVAVAVLVVARRQQWADWRRLRRRRPRPR
jgi:hypothetical protein